MTLRAAVFESVLWALLICVLGTKAQAQSGRRPPAPAEKPIVKLETREVVLPLRAYDAEGRDISDLTPKDLIVVEDGAQRTITYLKHQPANIVLVLDLSNEIGPFKNGPRDYNDVRTQASKEVLPRPAARELADNFVAQLDESDHLAIIQYSDKVQLIQDWTRDRAEALNALKSKYRVGLKSTFHDALALAAEKLSTRTAGRRVMVLVSDGWDSASRTSRDRAFAAIRRTNASVFVIGWAELLRQEIQKAINWTAGRQTGGATIWGSGPEKRIRELYEFLRPLDGLAAQLRELAETSGGEMWMPASFKEFVTSPRQVIREIGAQYSLAYLTERKSSPDDERSVQVFSTRPGLTLRTRRRYHADDDVWPEARKISPIQQLTSRSQSLSEDGSNGIASLRVAALIAVCNCLRPLRHRRQVSTACGTDLSRTQLQTAISFAARTTKPAGPG
jgi:VWFA-related protein